MCAATIDMAAEFRALCEYGQQQKELGSFDTAQHPNHRSFNPFDDVLPFDPNVPKFTYSETFISTGGSDDEGDKPTQHTRTYTYYNASTVLGRRAIAAHGPEQYMLGPFYAMIDQVGVTAIVTLSHEGYDYWTRNSDEAEPEVLFEKEGIKLFKRTLDLPDVGRSITHYYLDNWPDGDTIPPEVLAETIEKVGKVTGPLLVHCIAGIGRTGTFLAAYGAYLDPDEDIRDITHALRAKDTGRPGMINNIDQLQLVYDTAKVLNA